MEWHVRWEGTSSHLLSPADCGNCVARGIPCAGFGVRIQWPSGLRVNDRARRRLSRYKPPSPGVEMDAMLGRGLWLSPLGLPSEESFFMSHYIGASRDTGNGFLPPFLLTSILQEMSPGSRLLSIMTRTGTGYCFRWRCRILLS